MTATFVGQGLRGDVVPHAIFSRPVRYFAPDLREEEDDLDRYNAAAFSISDDLNFELRWYREHPPFTATAYMRFIHGSNDNPLLAIRRIVANLAIPKWAVAWKRGDDFKYGVLDRKPEDRLREPEARMLALKIAAKQPEMTASTQFIKANIPDIYPLSDDDLLPSSSRNGESRWQQIVGNVISHRRTESGIFQHGYAERTPEGLKVTPYGVDYLNRVGFSV